jgi:hypothetical protein
MGLFASNLPSGGRGGFTMEGEKVIKIPINFVFRPREPFLGPREPDLRLESKKMGRNGLNPLGWGGSMEAWKTWIIYPASSPKILRPAPS